MASPARRAALRVLLEVDQGGSTLAEILASRPVASLEPRERAFLHELVLGTLRRRGELDYSLEPLAERGYSRLDRPVRAILRLGAYQILHTAVPARAAVSEAVDLCRPAAERSAGLVNAVLRRLAREGARAAPDPDADPVGWLEAAGSLPRWLAERWVSSLGAGRARARARALLQEPPRVFRPHPRVLDPRTESLDARPLRVPGALEARAGQPALLAAEGLLYLQDEGSQLVAQLVPEAARTLDACAAPGGKSLLLSDRIFGRGVVVAAEASTRRLKTLGLLRARWGATNLLPLAADALRPPFAEGSFPAVLLDAPCTGLGTLARHPDLRWRVRSEDILRQAQRQRALLESVSGLVGPRGTLVYATCSSEREENEEVVEGFLVSHPEFRVGELPEWARVFASEGFARTATEEGGSDAFFAALLVRDGAPPSRSAATNVVGYRGRPPKRGEAHGL